MPKNICLDRVTAILIGILLLLALGLALMVKANAQSPPTAYVLETGSYGYWVVVPGIASEDACNRLGTEMNARGTYKPPHRCYRYEIAR